MVQMFSPEFVRPLQSVHAVFVQILLNGFVLQRRGKGFRLAVDFNDAAPAVTSRAGVSHVRSRIPDFRAKAADYRERLNEFFRGEASTFEFHDPSFPFRYASGGALPVVRLENADYYAAFYRECFPIGWNLANGGTDRRHELLNPYLTVERELREELLILDLKERQRYVLNIESDNPEDMPEYVAARELWEEKLRAPINSFRQLLTPLKWVEGPDSLEVRVGGVSRRTIDGCFLNVNPEDFGIEIDRIAKVSVDKGVTLCDGELHAGASMTDHALIDAPVGLFEVGRMNQEFLQGSNEFVPDRFFLGGKGFAELDKKELERFISERFVARVAGFSAKWDRREWDDAPVKFNLCPVTRGMVGKAVELAQPPQAFQKHQVFVAYATEDLAFADLVARRIEKETGLRVFFSKELDHSAFGKEIEEALASANCLVAVAGDPLLLSKPWPTFECRLFNILILNRRKPDNAQIMSYIRGFEARDLPVTLIPYNAYIHDEKEPERSLGNLIRDIKKSFPPGPAQG